MRVAIGADHAAFAHKAELVDFLRKLDYDVVDFGSDSTESVDYPDYAKLVAFAVANGEADRGIAICYTGVGMSIAANKVHGIRCALCSEPVSARLTREHNDSNVLAMGAGMIGVAMATEIAATFLSTEFTGGRHQRRVDKIMALEAR